MKHRGKDRTRRHASARPASGEIPAAEPEKPAAVTLAPATNAREAVPVVDNQVAAGKVSTLAGGRMLGGPIFSFFGQGAQLLEDFTGPLRNPSPSGEGTPQASGASAHPAGAVSEASTDGVPTVVECFLAGLEAAAGDPAPLLSLLECFNRFLNAASLGAGIGSTPARPLSPEAVHAYLTTVAAHLRNLGAFLEALEGATMAGLPDEIWDEIRRDMLPKMRITMGAMQTALRAVLGASPKVLGDLLSAIGQGAEALGVGFEVLRRALGIAPQAQA